MVEHVPTVRARQLGEGLRAVLEKAGVTGKQLARELGWSQSDVSRMLTGNRKVKEVEVAKVLGFCRVTGAEEERLLALCTEANKPGWYQQHGSRLPMQLRTYIDHEDKASAIADYAATLLPGSLQTAEYARAVISEIVNVPEDEVEERVAARMARQSIFGRVQAAKFSYYIHEFVLRLPVGGAVVMSDQLHHLLRMTVRKNVSIRVVPCAVGAHAGVEGSFSLMRFPQIEPVVYLESATTTIFLEESEEIAAYQRIVEALAATALDEEQSRAMIAALAVELYQDREEADGGP